MCYIIFFYIGGQLMQLSKVGFSQASLGFAAVSGDVPVLGETPSFYALLHTIVFFRSAFKLIKI
jgi:hypothetical protein